ncbi:MAG: phage tail protein [Bacteroidota bacterium]
MVDSYVGEIRMMGNTNGRTPNGWLPCNGALVSIQTYPALYSLIGTTYGGDGATTFAVPDLRGRLPVGKGPGPGLTPRYIGQSFGSEAVSLQPANTPAHSHALNTAGTAATTTDASNLVTFANVASPVAQYLKDASGGTMVSPVGTTISTVGGGIAHDNVMPCATINFIIATAGTYPQRN